jgi:hypothetical protein
LFCCLFCMVRGFLSDARMNLEVALSPRHFSRTLRHVLAAGVVGLGACGGSDGGVTPPPPPPVETGSVVVSLTASPSSVLRGDTVVYRAVPVADGGASVGSTTISVEGRSYPGLETRVVPSQSGTASASTSFTMTRGTPGVASASAPYSVTPLTAVVTTPATATVGSPFPVTVVCPLGTDSTKFIAQGLTQARPGHSATYTVTPTAPGLLSSIGACKNNDVEVATPAQPITVSQAPVSMRFQFVSARRDPVTDAISFTPTTAAYRAVINGDTVTAQNGVATVQVVPGTVQLGISSDGTGPATYDMNRYEIDGKPYFTWRHPTNSAWSKQTTNVTITPEIAAATQANPARIVVYEVNGNPLTPLDKYNRYHQIYGATKDQNFYPQAVGAHRATTQGVTMVKFYGTDNAAGCTATNPIERQVIDSVANQVKRESDDPLNNITNTVVAENTISSFYDLVTVGGETFPRAKPGYQILCTQGHPSNQPNNLTTWDVTGTPVGNIARFARQVEPSGGVNSFTGLYGIGREEALELHAGAFSEDVKDQGGFWDRLRITNTYSSDEREAQGVPLRVFARPIQAQQQASGQAYSSQPRFALKRR